MGYTLRPKTSNGSIFATPKGIPGPGTYESKASMTARGDHYLSKFKSSGATTFNPPSSKRFRDKLDKNLPGPAEYTPKLAIGNVSGQFLSKIPTPAGRTFYHFDRDTLKLPASARGMHLQPFSELIIVL